MKRILCPVDFSDFSRHAMDHAVALANWYHAPVSVLHVHRLSVPLVGIGPYVEPLTPTLLTDGERTHLLDALNDFVAAGRASGVPIDTILEEDVNVPVAIVERADRLKVDLITLGTHGRTGFGRWAFGSVAEKVLRTAACPVLTVPPRAAVVAPGAPDAIHRVLCPVDFSRSSAAALQQAASLVARALARLTVVHVVDLPTDVPDAPLPELFPYRDRLFDQASRALRESIPEAIRGMCPIDELLLVGRPYREILRLAHEQQADLIVMGVQGRGAMDLMFFGSTTQQVVRHATCPVLTVRAA